jgi:hypothetical protein
MLFMMAEVKLREYFHRVLLLAAICLGSAALAIFLAGTTILIKNDTLKAAVIDAFESGELVFEPYLGNDSRRGRYTVNDCLILQGLLVGRDEWRKFSLQSTTIQDPEKGVCATLKSYVQGEIDSTSLKKYEYSYSRYYFGARIFVGWGLAVMSLENMRILLRGSIYLLIFITIVVSLRGLLKGGAHNNFLYATTGIFSLGWLLSYDLWYYSPTLAHAFSELSLVGFMVYSVLTRPPRSNFMLYMPAIVLFILTAWFELLTGAMPLAIALAVAINFAHRYGENKALSQALQLWGVGVLIIVGCMLALLLFNAIFGEAQSLEKFVKHLAIRMNLHLLLGLSIDERWRIPENLHNYTLKEVWQAVIYHLPMLTGSLKWLAQVVFGVSALVLLLALPLSIFKQRYQSLFIPLSIGLCVVLWYLSFANHTVIHAWFMVRLMVLIPISAFMVLVFIFFENSKKYQI